MYMHFQVKVFLPMYAFFRSDENTQKLLDIIQKEGKTANTG